MINSKWVAIFLALFFLFALLVLFLVNRIAIFRVFLAALVRFAGRAVFLWAMWVFWGLATISLWSLCALFTLIVLRSLITLVALRVVWPLVTLVAFGVVWPLITLVALWVVWPLVTLITLVALWIMRTSRAGRIVGRRWRVIRWRGRHRACVTLASTLGKGGWGWRNNIVTVTRVVRVVSLGTLVLLVFATLVFAALVLLVFAALVLLVSVVIIIATVR